MENENWDVVVVGGGVAGLGATLTLGRARRRVLVVDAGSPRNRFAAHMHGVLGHEGVGPHDLLAQGREEVARYGVELVDGRVERVDLAADGVSLTVAEGRRVEARAVVVATGIADDLPKVPGLAERWGKTVLHCPYCHGWEVRDRRLGVLATSPMSLHQAQLVRQWSGDLVVFTDGLGEVDGVELDRLRARGVRLVPSPVVELFGDGGGGDGLAGVRTADGEEVGLDAIFTFGVPRPHDGFLAHLELERTEGPMGSFLSVDPQGRTSAERIWAVGNVVNPAASVPMAAGSANFVAATVNMALVAEDFDRAAAR